MDIGNTVPLTLSHDLGTVVFGLAASVSWGAGDFSGGLASRRANVFSVVAASYIVGLALLIGLALVVGEPLPSLLNIVWGSTAGLLGAVGLVSFYQALAVGRMGINAPITAVLAATVPVLASAFIDGLPSIFQLVGFMLALLAVWLISRPAAGGMRRPEGLGLALLAGLGFGGFFILISRVSAGSIFWPLAVARLTSFLVILLIMRIRHLEVLPKKGAFHLVLLAGILDVAGNFFFILATHIGRLDVASILSSLYPAITVLLAWIVLHERITRWQAIGVLVALIAIALISI